MSQLQERYVVGKILTNEEFPFDGCRVKQDLGGNVRRTMNRYLKRFSYVPILKTHNRERNELTKKLEIQAYRILAGIFTHIGSGVSRKVAYVTSIMRQRLPRLVGVEHVVDANKMMK